MRRLVFALAMGMAAVLGAEMKAKVGGQRHTYYVTWAWDATPGTTLPEKYALTWWRQWDGNQVGRVETIGLEATATNLDYGTNYYFEASAIGEDGSEAFGEAVYWPVPGTNWLWVAGAEQWASNVSGPWQAWSNDGACVMVNPVAPALFFRGVYARDGQSNNFKWIESFEHPE